MGIPDHLTCLLRNLYAGQEATVRSGHGTTDRFQIGKGVPRGSVPRKDECCAGSQSRRPCRPGVSGARWPPEGSGPIFSNAERHV